MKFDTQFHVSLRMNCNDFGDPLTFYLAASLGQDFNLSHITWKTNEIPISVNCTLCLVLISMQTL